MRRSHTHNTDHKKSERHKHDHDHGHKKHAPKPKKKKLSPFYKITLTLSLFGLIILSYFVILASAEPKSIPFVTSKIESAVKQQFGSDASLVNSYVSFTRYGSLKLAVNDLHIFYSPVGNAEKQLFLIPKLEMQFSLLNLLMMRFHPSEIKISNSEFVIDDPQKLISQSKEEIIDQPSQLSVLLKLLTAIRRGESPIANIEIENARLLVKGQKISTEILLKKAQIRTSVRRKVLYISSTGKFVFGHERKEADLGSACQLSKLEGLKCDVSLGNFAASSIADIHPNLSPLANINSPLNASASFAIKDGELGTVSFKVFSKKGNFVFLNFFKEKMDFANLSLTGEYDDREGILNLSEIDADLDESAVDAQNNMVMPHLEMSLLISDLKNPQSKKFDFYIKLKNVPNNKMDKFWPSALGEHGVRDWVITHATGGLVKNAYAKFSLVRNEGKNLLEDMDAQVVFSGFNLNYSQNFPTITNLSGVANFTNASMKISIADGTVLKSRISQGMVAIDSFGAKQIMLKISGKSKGAAADGLKHASSSPEFANNVEKYLNGTSQNEFDIRIPISKKIELKDTYIAVNSAVEKLDNGYVKGAVLINCKKDFGTDDFVASADLTASELIAKPFDIEKKTNIESGLNLTVAIKNPTTVQLQNINLWKKEPLEKRLSKDNSAKKTFLAKINADMEFGTAPFLLKSIGLKNSGFGKNDYALAYKFDRPSNSQKIAIKGKQLNLAPFIEGKGFKGHGDKKTIPPTRHITASLGRVILRHNKSLRNFSLSLNCGAHSCSSGAINAAYDKIQTISLIAAKKPKENFVTIEGHISDVGYLAEGFGISDVVSAGDAKVKIQNKIIDEKSIFEGGIKINNSITIYDNPGVKKLAKDTLFSSIKDKIFSKDKIIFTSVKLDFTLQDNILNIKSLLANNYKIGVTAKGEVDLHKNTYDIKGMIVPGFVINNLFGIGNIPIFGGVISGLLTGGQGGGVFGIRYEYVKKQGDKEPKFTTSKVSSFVPSSIKSLFDLI